MFDAYSKMIILSYFEVCFGWFCAFIPLLQEEAKLAKQEHLVTVHYKYCHSFGS